MHTLLLFVGNVFDRAAAERSVSNLDRFQMIGCTHDMATALLDICKHKPQVVIVNGCANCGFYLDRIASCIVRQPGYSPLLCVLDGERLVPIHTERYE